MKERQETILRSLDRVTQKTRGPCEDKNRSSFFVDKGKGIGA